MDCVWTVVSGQKAMPEAGWIGCPLHTVHCPLSFRLLPLTFPLIMMLAVLVQITILNDSRRAASRGSKLGCQR